MVKVNISYLGDLRTEITHASTGEVLYTDAPQEVHGKGSTFSPTDLFAASLGSCIATVLGMLAERKKWDIKGLRVEVEKVMRDEPYRYIGKLIVQVYLPRAFTEEEQAKIRSVAETCPVHKSLHPDIEVQCIYHWQVPVAG